MASWPDIEKKYFMHIIERTPLVIVKGKGAHVWDENGRKYLDFVGGWAVNSLGHCHPVLVKALTQQAKTLIQASNQFYTIPQLQLAELLVEHSKLNKVFFANSGAEANEGAIKLARRYGHKYLKGAYEVISTLDSFHGRTLAMVAATGQAHFQSPYPPLPTGFVNVAFNNIEAIKQATTEKTCAVILEPIQGEGGVNVPDDGYLPAVQAWCREKGILLMLDEVQTGLGRTGTLFAYARYGVEPDIMTLAKGLASGVAIGAILATDKASVFEPGEHGSTFGGNPLACAAAYACVKYIIDHDIPKHAGEIGHYLEQGLLGLKNKYPVINDVRGRGLLLAMGLKQDIAPRLILACLERGLLINKLKPSAIRLIPPLIIGKAEVDEAIGIIDDAIASLKI